MGANGVGMPATAWVDWRRGVSWADSVCQTASRTASGPRLVGSTDVNGVRMPATAWDGRLWGVGQSASGCRPVWGVCELIGVGASVGLGNLGRSRHWSAGRVLLAIVWVERHRDVGMAIGWRHGISGRGFGGRRQRGCLGRILGKRRL